MRVFEVEWPGPGRLAVVSRPAPESLATEMELLRAAGFDTLVSLLSGPEAAELGVRNEREAAEAAGLAFEWHPVHDFTTPDGECFRDGLCDLHDRLRAGAAIAAHCRVGVGRSPLLIASLLVLDGADWEDAWRRVSTARGVPVPDTDAQRQWIRQLAARAP
jgi:protein-tyrosine phosphatase